MRKNRESKKSCRTAKVRSSKPQVTDGRKAPPAVKRPVHNLTQREKDVLFSLFPEWKRLMEEADLPMARHGEKDLFVNAKKLPKAGLRQPVEKPRKARVDAAMAAKLQAGYRRFRRGRTLREAYILTLRTYFSQKGEGGDERPILLPPEQRPSYRQFRYWGEQLAKESPRGPRRKQ